VYEKVGVSADLLGSCRELLRVIEEEMNNPATLGESDDGELLGTGPLLASINSLCARNGWWRLPIKSQWACPLLLVRKTKERNPTPLLHLPV